MRTAAEYEAIEALTTAERADLFQGVMHSIICREHGAFAVGELNHIGLGPTDHAEGCPVCEGGKVYTVDFGDGVKQNASVATVKLLGGECPQCA